MFNQKYCPRSRRLLHDFTLIEMLVVIAIIGILASMLMPSLMKSVDAARNVYCANNLKQIGAAAMMYADNNNSWMPPAWSTSADYPVNPPVSGIWSYSAWIACLSPYFGTLWGTISVPKTSASDDFRCPSGEEEVLTYNVPPVAKISNYAYTLRLGGRLSWCPRNIMRRITSNLRPSQTGYVIDYKAKTFASTMWNMFSNYSGVIANADLRHTNSSMNSLFADNHVQTLMPAGMTNAQITQQLGWADLGSANPWK